MARRPAKVRRRTKRKAAKPTAKLNIVVAGDVFVDHHIYKGERNQPVKALKEGVIEIRELGGAMILHDLLQKLFANSTACKVHLGIEAPSIAAIPAEYHAFAYWSPHPRTTSDDDKKKGRPRFWRVELPMGYGAPDPTSQNVGPVRRLATSPHESNILVLDDAGIGFRHDHGAWPLPGKSKPKPDWIVLKMARPVAQGELWYELLSRNLAEKLVCVISVDELREECVSISRGLSWERVVEEVRDALQRSPEVSALTQCRHLIVRFAADGALWVDFKNRNEPTAKLVFDASRIEGSWDDMHEGTVVGSSTVFASAVVHGLAQSKLGEVDELVAAIKSGLAAVRDFEEFGHGKKEAGSQPSGFPAQRLADVIRGGDETFGEAEVPWPKPSDDRSAAPLTEMGQWMIVEDFSRILVGEPRRPLVGLARKIVRSGEAALADFPHARFGDLVAIDRREIELLRSVRRLMIGYAKDKKADKPLSIGVFGPPGAGKSFGVKQLANEIFTNKAWLEFNLSQFGTPTDLVGAFHQVRDKVLSGITPVVFWDEFDSRNLDWLQYLLAPMQDGRFQHEQLSHWIGKCVFVFAGGTSTTFEGFRPPQENPKEKPRSPELEEALTHFKLKKGPDFHSRLDGYYDVVGPNPRAKRRTEWAPNQELESDPDDVCYPLRRALFIRSKLKCEKGDQLDFDPDLLDALLLTPKFKHGARSLEKLIADLRPTGGDSIRRSSLLAQPLRAMHVEDHAFEQALNRKTEFLMPRTIDQLARIIHQMWLDEKIRRKRFKKPFDELSLVDQDDNRAGARRILDHLALAGLAVVRQDSNEPKLDRKEAENHLKSPLRIEHLAEAEHIGWMRQRIATGWRYGARRNDVKKIHPSLKPYSKLSKTDKDRDRRKIRNIPAMLEKVGYGIVRYP